MNNTNFLVLDNRVENILASVVDFRDVSVDQVAISAARMVKKPKTRW